MEQQNRSSDIDVFGVMPWAVDTPLVRAAAQEPREDVPISVLLHDARRRGRLATPDSVATEIWAAVGRGAEPGTCVHVGAFHAHEPAAFTRSG